MLNLGYTIEATWSCHAGLPVVSFLIKSARVEQVAGIKLLTRFSTSKGRKLWKSNILQHSVLKHHICCLRRHIPSQAINHDGRLWGSGGADIIWLLRLFKMVASRSMLAASLGNFLSASSVLQSTEFATHILGHKGIAHFTNTHVSFLHCKTVKKPNNKGL